ncbi:flavodoxin [Lederbergia lenta]|uniref:Ribonucleotide reductase-associated flavodoxin n=1 Tax=Lederbergia lenta TaxID=1467 RepID=A0A2X4VYF8_LEDLE|nr:flavodoxin [Lederbergia lenta]MCM3109370.1 flavodoxin [Lederbergia lenta]MEC2324865.1 flavodoxin [Lederbergia lenta]SQI57026.1 ribonucleotide reductase-associated flavodoxin [Lederbergia lenta]
MRILICYASYSGNTKEVAELIEQRLLEEVNHSVFVYRIGTGIIPDPSLFDLIMIGTFTWGKGATPDDVKDFVYEIGYKPPNVFIFGTGDTQFGGDTLFCHAAEKLAKFYQSTYKPLKIEQSPRGSQENTVIEWTEGVLKHCLKH